MNDYHQKLQVLCCTLNFYQFDLFHLSVVCCSANGPNAMLALYPVLYVAHSVMECCNCIIDALVINGALEFIGALEIEGTFASVCAFSNDGT
jgi:hypothetical protein